MATTQADEIGQAIACRSQGRNGGPAQLCGPPHRGTERGGARHHATDGFFGEQPIRPASRPSTSRWRGSWLHRTAPTATAGWSWKRWCRPPKRPQTASWRRPRRSPTGCRTAARDPASIAAATEKVNAIFEACSFQDVTGQRIRRAIQHLQQVEEMLTELSPPPRSAQRCAVPAGNAADLSQDAVDAMFG